MGFLQFEDYEPRHLSFSSVDGYRTCGKRFYLQKIARVEQRPGLAGIGGNAVHAATEHIDRLIFEHGLEILDGDKPPF